ncbi:MAG: 4'-phosphopantetheinyl transferase superfamily protein [Gammaproteobacteria bacterium]
MADPANRASAANPAFHRRVLCDAERAHLTAGSDTALWAHWAAKETAYKALKPTCPSLVFAHRLFVVSTTETFATQSGRGEGVVDVDALSVSVCWEWTGDYVHCVTTLLPAAVYAVAPLDALRREVAFSELAAREALSDESVAVRVLALQLLAHSGIEGASIERSTRKQRAMPPRILHPTKEIALSLSHDARFAAAALRLP